MNDLIAQTPEPPYYAVIFTSIRSMDADEYAETANRMIELVEQMEGFLGYESARDGLGITVSYWRDLESIHRWKNQTEHTLAREKGRKQWYLSFKTRIALVEKDYEFHINLK